MRTLFMSLSFWKDRDPAHHLLLTAAQNLTKNHPAQGLISRSPGKKKHAIGKIRAASMPCRFVANTYTYEYPVYDEIHGILGTATPSSVYPHRATRRDRHDC